jgi:thiamine pyrophosphate-dependent acetolactate synthase large subunit-like protein
LELLVKVHAAAAAALRDHGADVMFGLMGDANMLVVASYIEEIGGRFVPVAHEAGAVSMADGYHRATGRIGVASITHGPAFTNTLTALAEAARFGSAVLVMTGAPPSMRGHLQQIDIAALAADVGAGYERAWSPASMTHDLAVAARRAVTQRRPIVFDLPSSLLLADVDYQAAAPVTAPELGAPDEDVLDRALGIMLSAARPVIVAGRGAANERARTAIIDFARTIGAPLSTTLVAKDLFAGLPENIGICGSLSTPPAVDAIANSDCVISFGASLSRHTAAGGDLFAGKPVIQCSGLDSPEHEFVVPTVHVAADAALAAREFTRKAREAGVTPRVDNVRRAVEQSERWEAERAQWTDRSGAETVDLARTLRSLSCSLPADRFVVSDAGRFTLTAWHEVAAETPGAFTHTASFGSIGLGLATAIGASVAEPSRLTVCLVGDGGFMMAAVHLWSAVQARANLLVVVVNDGSYGAEYDKLGSYGVTPELSLLSWPNLAELARAYGLQARTIASAADLELFTGSIDQLHGPMLLDLRVDPKFTANYDGSPQ